MDDRARWKVYELSAKTENPMRNTPVKLITNRVKKLEAQVTKLEGKPKLVAKKKTKKVEKSKK